MGLYLDSVHSVVLAFGALMIWLAQPGSSLFSYHPALMTLGILVIGLEGILLMKDRRVALKNKVTVHWICEVLGLLLTYLGFLAIYNNKENKGAEHFTTWHGKLGLVSLALLSMAPMGGIVAKYSVFASKLVGLKPKLIKEIHRNAGVAASIASLGTVILALYSTWFQGVVSENTWYIALGLLLYPRFYFGYLRIKGL